jgi:GDPmannose 4,6-dehydratase
VNLVAVHAVLEYQRRLMPSARLVYASSSKVFGEQLPAVVTESSPRQSTCIYTTTKNAATDLIAYYRKRYNSKSSILWTFSHESSRRGPSYFLPKVVDALAKAIVDPSHVAEIASLAFWGDWGDASEYMQIIARFPDELFGTDMIFATGQTIWASDFVDTLFGKYGLNWRNHLVERFPLVGVRPAPWRVDISRLVNLSGATPSKGGVEIASEILRENYPEIWQITNGPASRQ